jgi:hypothetical protein
MGNHRSIPPPFRAEIHTLHDALSLAVVRAAIDLRDRIQLGRRETVVAIRSGWTLSIREIDLRPKRAAWRIINHTIADAIGRVAFLQYRIAQHLPLGKALRDAVAIAIEREIPRKVIRKHALRHPDVASV